MKPKFAEVTAPKSTRSVAWLLTVLVGAVFVVEALVMALLPMLPPMSELAAALLDATLLSFFISPLFYFLAFRPLTSNIADLNASQARLQLAASVFSHAREGIMITEIDGTIVEVNDTFSRITGYSRQDVVGRNPRIMRSGRHAPEHYKAMWRALIKDGYWDGEVWNRRKNGEVFAEVITISAVSDGTGTPRHYVALFSDVTQLKDRESKLEHLAHYDALTGLPNRILLADRLRQAIAQSQRRNNSSAVVYIDLDGFKAVNDTNGHEVGDELLIAISRGMHEEMRDGDTLARVGGDEFVAVLIDIVNLEDCEPILLRLLQAAACPVTVRGAVVQVSASIGVAFCPQDGLDSDQLLNYADQAMYGAKQAGKSRYQVFGMQGEKDSVPSLH